MRSLVPKLFGLATAALLAALVVVPAASAAPAVTGKFALGSELGTNNKITAGPDGNMWFTLENETKDVGDITPAGIVQEFELPNINGAESIAAGPEGRLWVVAMGKATSFLPSDPKGTEKTFESAKIKNSPSIVFGPDGMFWVASSNAVAKFSPTNFEGTIVEVPVTGALSPKDIDVAGSLIVISDNEAVGLAETSRVVTFTTAGVQKDFTIPGGSQGLAGAPSGQIAYSAAGAKPEQAGLITPPGPASAFELLGDPFGVAFGSDGAFWIARFAAGGVTRLTTTGQTSILPGFAIESPRQIAAGPNNTLWVTLQKKEEKGQPTAAIGRISGVELPPPTNPTTPSGGGGTNPTTPPPPAKPPVPDTVLGKDMKVFKTTGPKATVRLAFTSSVSGSTFQCAVTKTPKPKKGKKRPKPPKPTFSTCSSPKVLRLGPGKYRFAVRAVSAGGTDPSPAELPFTVVRIARHPAPR
jgi:streptogramin lyase